MRKLYLFAFLFVFLLSAEGLSFAASATRPPVNKLESALQNEIAVEEAKHKTKYEQEEEHQAEAFVRFKAKYPLPVEPKFEDLTKEQKQLFAMYYSLQMSRFIKLPKPDAEVQQQYLENAKARFAYMVAVAKGEEEEQEKKPQATGFKNRYEQEEERLAKAFEKFKATYPLPKEPKFDNLLKEQQRSFFAYYQTRMSKFIKLPPLDEETQLKYLENAKARYAYLVTVFQLKRANDFKAPPSKVKEKKRANQVPYSLRFEDLSDEQQQLFFKILVLKRSVNRETAQPEEAAPVQS